jgi:hypothetical protein
MPFRLAFIVLVAAATSATQADKGDSPIVSRTKTNPTLAAKANWQPVTSGHLDNGVRFARFAPKPLRAEFTGPLQAETTIHAIQQTSPIATTPAAAVTFKWHF